MRHFGKKIFWWLLLTSTAASASELYSETVAVSYADNWQSASWYRHDLTEGSWHSPYFKLGGEMGERWSRDFTVGDNTFVFLAPGWRVFGKMFGAYAEARFREFAKERAGSSLDARVVGYYSTIKTWPWRSGRDFFVEPYGELVFTSAQSNNAILSGYTRFGIRQRWGEGPSIDLFFEPFLSVDRRNYDFNNWRELRFSVRGNLPWEKVLFRPSASLTYGTREREVGFRLLLVMGGTW